MTSIRQQARDLGVAPSTVLRRIRAGRDPSAIKPGARRGPQTDPQKVEAVRALAHQGLTSGQIAQEMGIDRRMTVTEIAARHGIDLPRRRRTIQSVRDQVQDMTQREAVEHLLYLVEELLGSSDEIAEIRDRLQVTPAAAKVYCALRRAAPRAMTQEQLLLASSARHDTPADTNVAVVHVAALRRALPAGEAIRTIWGVGYKWERTAP